MEKVCEFCKSLRPIVYCEADAAHLCLLCDAKVHSANTLSSRHPRALLCQVCKCRTARVRCNDHDKFACSFCDCSLNENTSQHQKRIVRSYMGCPSAKDFASLWGFEMNFGLEIPKYRFGKQVRGRVVSQHAEVHSKDDQNQNISSILQQIIELEKLQIYDANNVSSFIGAKQQSNLSASIYSISSKFEKTLQHPLNVEPFTSLFPLEDSTSSSIVGNDLHGEPFLECESHDHDFEMWSESIQEFGICEQSAFFDNSNIPEIDVSFRNYEELFECNQEIDTALFDEKKLTTPLMENDTTFLGKADHSYTGRLSRLIETEECKIGRKRRSPGEMQAKEKRKAVSFRFHMDTNKRNIMRYIMKSCA